MTLISNEGWFGLYSILDLFFFSFFFYLRESGSATAQHYSFLLKLILPYDLKVERWAWGRNQRLAVWMWASPAANLGDGICDLSTHVPKSSPDLFHLEPAGAWLVKLVALTAWQPGWWVYRRLHASMFTLLARCPANQFQGERRFLVGHCRELWPMNR